MMRALLKLIFVLITFIVNGTIAVAPRQFIEWRRPLQANTGMYYVMKMILKNHTYILIKEHDTNLSLKIRLR